MLKTLIFFFSLIRTSIRGSLSLRGAFFLESTLMLGNNMIFLSMWWIFFRQFREVNGWTMNDMLALNAIGMGAYGLMLICFGGVRNLSRIILQGDLDPFMTQPKNLLLHLMGAKSFSKGWGVLMTSALFIFLGKFTTLATLTLILVAICSGSLIFAAINIIVHSAAFWMGSIEGVAKKYCDSVFVFALYPTNIYSGALQVVMFTFIPAGFIGYLPVELLRSFSWIKLGALLGSSLLFLLLAFAVFYRGLKRYESGNRFGMRL